MTPQKAAENFRKMHPDREIMKACEYKGKYLFVAPDKNLGMADFNDPYFLMDKVTGVIRQINPAPEIREIGQALASHEIKI